MPGSVRSPVSARPAASSGKSAPRVSHTAPSRDKRPRLPTVDVAEVTELAESWQRHLRVCGCQPNTISVYRRAVRQHLDHAGSAAALDRESLVATWPSRVRSAWRT